MHVKIFFSAADRVWDAHLKKRVSFLTYQYYGSPHMCTSVSPLHAYYMQQEIREENRTQN